MAASSNSKKTPVTKTTTSQNKSSANTPTKRKCPWCDTLVDINIPYCPECGEKLIKSYKPNKKKKKHPVLGFSLVILGILIFFGAISSGSNSKSNNSENSSSKKVTSEKSNQSEKKNIDKNSDYSSDSLNRANDSLQSVLDDYAPIINNSDIPSGVSKSQENAIRSAINYLEFTAFSKNGLIHQLSSEYADKYSMEDATFAVNYLEQNGLVDWNEQAIKSAKNYLNYTAFSKIGLIHQLSSDTGENFTNEQAE